MCVEYCDQYDCPLHPKNIDDSAAKIRPIENHGMFIMDSPDAVLRLGDTDISGNASSMRVKNNFIDVSIECLMCVHFKPVDMKKEIIRRKAKELLNEKSS